jgi:DNA-binding winged helix-turn-helix (wHTH) protein
LLREGKPVPITPKVFDLLQVLAQHQGHLLEKEELMRAVWPDAVVEEANLSANISILRKALGDGINGQVLIETVPKRGYRFIAPVREEDSGRNQPGVSEPFDSRIEGEGQKNGAQAPLISDNRKERATSPNFALPVRWLAGLKSARKRFSKPSPVRTTSA